MANNGPTLEDLKRAIELESPTEREARQKALEKWDRHKRQWSEGHGSLGAFYGSEPND